MPRRIRAWMAGAVPGQAAPSATQQSQAVDRLREARAAALLAQAELHKAAAEKERRQALESHSKRLTGYIDTAKTAIPLVAAGYGMLATFLYCFMAIQFFPSGLSVGDNLLFVFVALGFGLLACILVVLGGAAFLPLVVFEAAEKQNPAQDGGQGKVVFWILVPAIAKAASFLTLWTFYASPFAPADFATTGLMTGHLFSALVLGALIGLFAWKSGTAASIWKSLEWVFIGSFYGFIELWLLPWLSLTLPQYTLHFLALPWMVGLLAWLLISTWTRPPVRKKDPADSPSARRPRTRAETFARVAGVLALILAGVVSWMASPFEHTPAHTDTEATQRYWAFGLSILTLTMLVMAFIAEAFSRPKGAALAHETQTADGTTGPAAMGGPAALPTIQSAYALESRIYFSVLLLLVIYGAVLWADSQIQGQLSSGIFRSLGLRAEQQTLRLKGDALALVRSQAEQAGIFLSFCAEPGGAALVTPVDALWHGMGTRSLLRIGKDPGGRKGAASADPRTNIEVNSEEVKIVRNAHARCHDIEHAVYFRSNSVEVVNNIDELVDAVARVQESLSPPASPGGSGGSSWRLDKVVVTGHSDPLPLSDAANQDLSERRAKCVADWVTRKALNGTQLTGDYRLETRGQGSRDLSAAQCPLEGRAANLQECHERNRRATVRLILTWKPPLPGEAQQALFRQAERASAEAGRSVACAAKALASRS